LSFGAPSAPSDRIPAGRDRAHRRASARISATRLYRLRPQRLVGRRRDLEQRITQSLSPQSRDSAPRARPAEWRCTHPVSGCERLGRGDTDLRPPQGRQHGVGQTCDGRLSGRYHTDRSSASAPWRSAQRLQRGRSSHPWRDVEHTPPWSKALGSGNREATLDLDRRRAEFLEQYWRPCSRRRPSAGRHGDALPLFQSSGIAGRRTPNASQIEVLIVSVSRITVGLRDLLEHERRMGGDCPCRSSRRTAALANSGALHHHTGLAYPE